MVMGRAGLKRRFAEIPERIKREVEAELDVVGSQLVAEMESLAPRRGGDLVKSIGFDRGSRKNGALGISALKSGTAVGRIGITVFAGRGLGDRKNNHAFYQEFGTKEMPANPYFFPVWRSNRARVKARLSRAVTRAFKKS